MDRLLNHVRCRLQYKSGQISEVRHYKTERHPEVQDPVLKDTIDELAVSTKRHIGLELDEDLLPSVRCQPGQADAGHPFDKPVLSEVEVLRASLTYNCIVSLSILLGNFMRGLALPEPVKHWSLTSIQTRFIKIGGRLVRHARRLVFRLAEVILNSIWEIQVDYKPEVDNR